MSKRAALVLLVTALALGLSACAPVVSASRPLWRDPDRLHDKLSDQTERVYPEHDPDHRSLFTPIPEPDDPLPEAVDLSIYPVSLQNFYSKYPQVRDYVLHYFDYKDVEFDIDLSEYASCTEVPLLLQWDKRWGYRPYIGSMLGPSGCGPTALSMAAIYLTHDTSLDPLTIARYAERHQYANSVTGTQWTLFSQGPAGLGMTSQAIGSSKATIEKHLKAGEIVAVNVGRGYFTYSGHFILLVGLSAEGQYIIRDPNSVENSDRTWRHEDIVSQFKGLWALKKAD